MAPDGEREARVFRRFRRRPRRTRGVQGLEPLAQIDSRYDFDRLFIETAIGTGRPRCPAAVRHPRRARARASAGVSASTRPASASPHCVSSGSQNTQTLQVACARHRAQHADADAAKPRRSFGDPPAALNNLARVLDARDAQTRRGDVSRRLRFAVRTCSGTSAPWSFRLFASSRLLSWTLAFARLAVRGVDRVRGARAFASAWWRRVRAYSPIVGGHRRGRGTGRSSPVSRSAIAATASSNPTDASTRHQMTSLARLFAISRSPNGAP